jgi:hypothetical protein
MNDGASRNHRIGELVEGVRARKRLRSLSRELLGDVWVREAAVVARFVRNTAGDAVVGKLTRAVGKKQRAVASLRRFLAAIALTSSIMDER